MVFRLRVPKVNDVANKTVLVRVDFNVPLLEFPGGFRVKNDNRIQAALETINYLVSHDAKTILISHLGRPEGKPNPKYSLAPIAHHLSQKLHQPTLFCDDTVGEKAQQAAKNLKPGEVLLLENLRFHAEEENNDAGFAKKLASLADLYINEAFSASHRAHASTEGVTHFLPSFAGAGFNEEVSTLHRLMTNPRRPFVIVIGGAKISDKVEAVVNLTHLADQVLVGGGVANNFLKAEGFEIAKSFIQDTPADLKKKGVDYVSVADHLLAETKASKQLIEKYIPLPKIVYPIDVMAGSGLEARTSHPLDLTQKTPEGLRADDMFLDIGPKTAHLYAEIISRAGTVFWNGPMGVFENKEFALGTRRIANAIAKTKATTILGGGDTQSAIGHFGLSQKFDYISTAGGAALDFLAGKELPGLKPLLD